MNHAGRVRVTLFCTIEDESGSASHVSIPFDELNAVSVKPHNLTVLSKKIQNGYMGLLRNSLVKAPVGASRTDYYFAAARAVEHGDAHSWLAQE